MGRDMTFLQCWYLHCSLSFFTFPCKKIPSRNTGIQWLSYIFYLFFQTSCRIHSLNFLLRLFSPPQEYFLLFLIRNIYTNTFCLVSEKWRRRLRRRENIYTEPYPFPFHFSCPEQQPKRAMSVVMTIYIFIFKRQRWWWDFGHVYLK